MANFLKVDILAAKGLHVEKKIAQKSVEVTMTPVLQQTEYIKFKLQQKHIYIKALIERRKHIFFLKEKKFGSLLEPRDEFLYHFHLEKRPNMVWPDAPILSQHCSTPFNPK